MVVFPRTPAGILAWSKHKGHADLNNYDESHRTRQAQKWEKHKSTKTVFEEADKDLYDWWAEEDLTLNRRERKDELLRKQKDYMRIWKNLNESTGYL